MKKCFLLICLSFFSLVIWAQDKESSAYKTGYAIGKITGMVLIAGFVIWIIRRSTRKKKK